MARDDVVQLERLEARLRLGEQRLVPLDRVDHAAEQREHRCLVAGAGADLQHAMSRLDLQLLRGIGHDVRLADGLAAGDGQRAVVIGAYLERLVDELLAWRSLDGAEHPLVGDALPPERHDQRYGPRIGHLSVTRITVRPVLAACGRWRLWFRPAAAARRDRSASCRLRRAWSPSEPSARCSTLTSVRLGGGGVTEIRFS